MNKDWVNLWKEDIERRAAEAQAPMEQYKARLDEYAALVDHFRARAEAAGITEDHPLVRVLAQGAAAMKLEIPAVPLIEPPPLPDLPEPPKVYPDLPEPPMV